MGDGLSIGFVDFPALLFDFDHVRCVLARSILVRNWCGLWPYVVIAGGQSEGFCYLTKSRSHLLKLRFSACDSKAKVAGIIAICFFDCKLAPKALNLRLPFEGQWGTQKTNSTAGASRAAGCDGDGEAARRWTRLRASFDTRRPAARPSPNSPSPPPR